MFDKLHIVITLIASIIVAVFCIFSDKSLSHCVLCIIITILAFFILGCIARHYAQKWFPEPQKEQDDIVKPDDIEEQDTGEEDETPADENSEQALNSR